VNDRAWGETKHSFDRFLCSLPVVDPLVASRQSHRSQPTFSAEYPYGRFAGPGFNITGDRAEGVHGIHVSGAWFRVFGAPVMLGRTFTPQEDTPNGGHVVVLSYGLWQGKFGGRQDIIGKSLPLGNEPYTIVDVLAGKRRKDTSILMKRSTHMFS
jgi:hypothetical protein